MVDEEKLTREELLESQLHEEKLGRNAAEQAAAKVQATLLQVEGAGLTRAKLVFWAALRQRYNLSGDDTINFDDGRIIRVVRLPTAAPEALPKEG